VDNEDELCSFCHQNPPESFLINVTEGHKSRTDLCQTCWDAVRELADKNAIDFRLKLAEMEALEELGEEYDNPDPGAFLSQKFEEVPEFLGQAIAPAEKKPTYKVLDPEVVFLPERLNSKRCVNCGLMLTDYFLQECHGCKFCFYEFKEEIREYLAAIDEQLVKVSSRPAELDNSPTLVDLQDQVVQLELLKRQATENEDWTEAIRCRDEIIALKDRIKNFEG
jgi:protein-arginine kinase activator protein McsA